ncbi:hypothetical protein MSNKSG1_02826 [Marinobacter santoriniensis NKSG1]|uniref:Uncharacterized protein n=1 Tax=Marinobacter santoriniensis NKSG1 TaxID=1288826 RepID=M7D8B8_9GAMM|nr:hypothetical protein MSNKSG1_02826 [Marinobacter santoriniensis NKSG1]
MGQINYPDAFQWFSHISQHTVVGLVLLFINWTNRLNPTLQSRCQLLIDTKGIFQPIENRYYFVGRNT